MSELLIRLLSNRLNLKVILSGLFIHSYLSQCFRRNNLYNINMNIILYILTKIEIQEPDCLKYWLQYNKNQELDQSYETISFAF